MTTTHTTLPDWWIETTLGEVCDIQSWKTRPKESWIFPVYWWNGILDYANNFNIEKESIIIWRVWAYYWCVYYESNKFWLSDNALWLVNNKKSDLRFLYYFLINQNLNKKSIWWAQPLLTQWILNSIEIVIPPLPEQKAIAKILSSFDDKIELLREQNETLEKMAQTIFEEWFWKYSVDDKLPEGWRVGKLGEELETFLWWTPSKLNDNFWQNGTIPWINSWEVNNFRIIEATEMITEEALKKSATKILPKWTVVIAITWATLWQYSRLEIDCCFNQSVVWIKENEKIQSSYIYFWIASNIWNIIRNATWWAHQHINKENVNQTDFLVPNNDVLIKFYELANPIMEKISNNMFEIKELSKTRDELLPKLMKGEVRVV